MSSLSSKSWGSSDLRDGEYLVTVSSNKYTDSFVVDTRSVYGLAGLTEKALESIRRQEGYDQQEDKK